MGGHSRFFICQNPPGDFDAMHLHDYRRLPASTQRLESPELIAEIRRAFYRRELVLELAEDWEDAPRHLEAYASQSEGAERVGARVRHLLGVPLQEQIHWKGDYGALHNWRFALEAAGVLVFQAWGIDISEMRGLSVPERPFPVIMVNVKDSARGRIFSLLHEFTHILLRDSSLCDLSYYREPRSPDLREVERFCDSVAAAALIPKDDLLAQTVVARKSKRSEWSWDELRWLSSRYVVSDQALLRRLLTLNKIDDSFYWQTLKGLQKRYKKRKKPDSSSSGGPHPSEKVLSNAGQFFTELVLDSYRDERITAADLSDYLEVKLNHIPRIEDLIRRTPA